MSETNTRPDNRAPDALRTVTFEPGIAPHATGSVLVAFGRTRVICSAMIEQGVPRWMKEQKVEGGWITAEYSMLPYSTLDRKARDSSRGKVDGRTVEIQRLIGRSLRAAIDLAKLPGKTLWLDCDVLQADGGTRTAAITGAWVAARLAVDKLMREGSLAENPIIDNIAAISVGIVDGQPRLDLEYVEDRDAEVDCNIVMTGNGRFIEIQGSGEESTFSRDQFNALLDLAAQGIDQLTALQNAALATQS